MTTLDDYLNLQGHGPQGNSWSCFAADLRDARTATGRNLDSGEVVDVNKQGNWLGAVGYLCLFDQLGSTVELAAPDEELVARIALLPGGPTTSERSFRATLYQFSDVNDIDSATLWALRNSLAHNYSLINIPSNANRVNLRHWFTLVSGGNNLVTYSQQPWDGGFPGNGSHTIVSVTGLAAVGEQVAQRVIQEHADGNIKAKLSDDVLRLRYFFMVGHLGLNPASSDVGERDRRFAARLSTKEVGASAVEPSTLDN